MLAALLLFILLPGLLLGGLFVFVVGATHKELELYRQELRAYYKERAAYFRELRGDYSNSDDLNGGELR